MTDQPHHISHDPYPPNLEDRDPMAERRRNSAAFHDAVDAAIAAKPKAPTHITRTRDVEDGVELTVDDGHGTTVSVTRIGRGRLAIGVGTDERALVVELGLGDVGILAGILRDLAGLGAAAPITGSR